jgi:hypothetical protein
VVHVLCGTRKEVMGIGWGADRAGLGWVGGGDRMGWRTGRWCGMTLVGEVVAGL